MYWIIRLKGCTRCSGDLSVECDRYGTYASCLQCGASINDVTEPDWEEVMAEAL